MSTSIIDVHNGRVRRICHRPIAIKQTRPRLRALQCHYEIITVRARGGSGPLLATGALRYIVMLTCSIGVPGEVKEKSIVIAHVYAYYVIGIIITLYYMINRLARVRDIRVFCTHRVLLYYTIMLCGNLKNKKNKKNIKTPLLIHCDDYFHNLLQIQ